MGGQFLMVYEDILYIPNHYFYNALELLNFILRKSERRKRERTIYHKAIEIHWISVWALKPKLACRSDHLP